MTAKLTTTLFEAACKMADSLICEAEYNLCLEDLKVILSLVESKSSNSLHKFLTELDNMFNDGGAVRCEKFMDLGMPYSLQFGPLETMPFDMAQGRVLSESIVQLRQRLRTIGR